MDHGSTRLAPAWPHAALTAAAGILLAAAAIPAARAEAVSALRLRLNPNAVADGVLSPATQARMEMRLGTKVTVVSNTRTGAIDLELATPQDGATLRPKLTAMRADR